MLARVSRRTTIISSVAVSVLFLVMLALPSVTWATPRFAQATGQPCSQCHVDPAGGGPRNAFGQSFEAIPTYSSDPAGAFRQLTSAPAAPAAPAPAAPAAPAPAAPAPAAPAASPAAPAAPAAAPAAPAPAAGAAPAAGKPPVALPATGDGGASSSLPAAIALLGFSVCGAGLALRRARAGAR